MPEATGRTTVSSALVLSGVGVVIAMICAVLFGSRICGAVIAVILMCVTVARAIAAPPSPRGLVVRSRQFDVACTGVMAVLIMYLVLTADSL